MIKKDYYKLTELIHKTAIDSQDYEYVIKQFKETLYIDLYAQPVLLVDEYLMDETDKDFTLADLAEKALRLEESSVWYKGLCIGEYSGLARLTKFNKKTLLRQKSVNIELVILDDVKSLKSVEYVYPFSTPLPNSLIKNWEGDLENETLGIKAYLIKQLSGELVLELKPIKFDDVITPQYQVKHIKDLITPISEKCENDTVDIKRRSDDFNDFVHIIVDAEKGLTVKGYWRIIERESEEFEGHRLLDKYNIIREVTATHIIWQDRTGLVRKPISFKSLANRITKIRKEI